MKSPFLSLLRINGKGAAAGSTDDSVAMQMKKAERYESAQQRESASVEAERRTYNRIGLSIVVPCYNEQPSIKQLAERLETLAGVISDQYCVQLVFVDDGSSDATYQLLTETFDRWPEVQVVRHEQNRGLIAALTTGFKNSSGQWIACLDADCTYDPTVLIMLLEHMEQGYDVVTASPYHSLGKVEGVAAWRIAISRVASGMYRLLFRSKLSCYTCCVRVYDAEMVKGVSISTAGFVGVTELLWRLDRMGARVGEVPVTLRTRVTGVSKMKTVRTACRHLRFLASIAFERLFQPTGQLP